jgi:superfamily I DNA and/or RNA helicase
VERGSYTDKMEYVGKELRGKIGIITPYKSQVRTLRDCIYPRLRALKLTLDTIEINTVDAY